MSGKEQVSEVIHDLAVEARKLMQEERRIQRASGKVSDEDRDLIRSTLSSLAEFLIRNYELTIPQSRRYLEEMLTVTI